jgi:hypothetical protein
MRLLEPKWPSLAVPLVAIAVPLVAIAAPPSAAVVEVVYYLNYLIL